MNTTRVIPLAIAIWVWGLSSADAQGFSSGSNGSFGPINVTSGTVTIDLPPDGIIHATTVTVASGATLRFNRNALNTPAFLLATGDINVVGTIDVSGEQGRGGVAGRGGPGGFDGGSAGFSGIAPGAGHGPGAGLGHTLDGTRLPGHGAYASTRGNPQDGKTYGTSLLVPLVGGSGGGGLNGSPGPGGGGGGGAILLASNTRVTVSGAIQAQGRDAANICDHAGGSGGAIRIVAPIVSGNGNLNVQGVCGNSFNHGRIRIDTVDRSGLFLSFNPSTALSIGAFMVVFTDVVARLDIVEAAGQVIPEGTAGPVLVTLPFGSSTSRTVIVQARDFTGIVPINVVLTPESGDPTTYPAEINMGAGNPARVTVNVEIPVNTITRVNAWSR